MSDQEGVLLRGEDVVLRPRAVLTLAMAFHELATNAAKYGALSVSAGRIEIYWQPVRVADHKRSVLRIDWLEKGGPPVTYPRQRSFGSKIEGSIAAELRWKSQRRFSGERRGLKGASGMAPRLAMAFRRSRYPYLPLALPLVASYLNDAGRR